MGLTMKAGTVGLLTLVTLYGCKKQDPPSDAEKKNRVFEVDISSKGSENPANFTRNFDALCKWCEQSVVMIKKTNEVNPIRGNELLDSKLDYIRRELEGKTVYWKVKVNGIDLPDKVRVGSFHTIPRDLIDNSGRLWKSFDYILSVRLQKTHGFEGLNITYDPAYTVKDVPMSKMRELNIGELALLTGTAAKINYNDFFNIVLDGAKIK